MGLVLEKPEDLQATVGFKFLEVKRQPSAVQKFGAVHTMSWPKRGALQTDGGLPHAKRNKASQSTLSTDKKTGLPLPLVVRPTHLLIRMAQKTKEHAGLINPDLIYIDEVTYLDGIADSTDFLYDIVGRIFRCDIGAVKLYHQHDGQWRDEEGHGWHALERPNPLEDGNYLCIVCTSS